MTETLPALRLKKGEDKRLRAGHLWVFSNEVDTDATPLKAFAPGDGAVLEDSRGRVLGTVYVNPGSLICARLVSRDSRYRLDESLLVHRLKMALALRERLFEQPYYRLVHGEADGLPGLVVDRFGDACVVQVNTAGMERVRDSIVTALARVLGEGPVLLRCDSAVRELEGLERYQVWGSGPERQTLEVVENGVQFRVPATSGQKTGWYFDHRMNRQALRPWVSGQRVLDVFSYMGAWGVQAAVAGAREVYCVDSSEQALDGVAENAALNGVADQVVGVQGDAFDALAELRQANERFDVVVVDPPAFIKRKKDFRQGYKAYQRLNRMAMQLLGRDGLLVTASCSAHLPEQQLLDAAQSGARHLERSLRVVALGHQGPDHPVHPAIPETRYLKAAFCRVLPAGSMP